MQAQSVLDISPLKPEQTVFDPYFIKIQINFFQAIRLAVNYEE